MGLLGRAGNMCRDRIANRKKLRLKHQMRRSKIERVRAIKRDATAFCAAALPREREEHFEIILFVQPSVPI